MARISVPYFVWRDGRPRWEPGPGLRDAGFKGQDLRAEDGSFLPRGAAMEAAEKLNAEVDAWRRAGGGKLAARQRKAAAPSRSVKALWLLYADSPRFKKLSHHTRIDYASKYSIFVEAFGDAPVASISKSHLYTWWEELYRDRSHSMANAVLAVVRTVMSYGIVKGWRGDNPARELGLESLAPRCVVWTSAEVVAAVDAANRLGLPEIGEACITALHSGQRLGDVLELDLLSAENGRIVLRQSKRGARVSIPHTPQLDACLAAIRARRSETGVTSIALARRIVLDAGGHTYTPRRFHTYFSRVRDEAAKAEPGIAGKQFADLRDTAVTRLGQAGCTVPEIRSITGHEMATIHQVLKHYMALDEAMADTAIGKVVSYMQEKGYAL